MFDISKTFQTNRKIKKPLSKKPLTQTRAGLAPAHKGKEVKQSLWVVQWEENTKQGAQDPVSLAGGSSGGSLMKFSLPEPHARSHSPSQSHLDQAGAVFKPVRLDLV